MLFNKGLFFLILLFATSSSSASCLYVDECDSEWDKNCLRTCYETCHDCNYCNYQCYRGESCCRSPCYAGNTVCPFDGLQNYGTTGY